MAKKILNLLVIDEEQLYAEHLISMLSAYFDEVNLGFWDEKAEFVKSLRQEWDVLVFHRAYDMSFTDVVGILQEQNVALPVIQLVQSADTSSGLPDTIDGDMVKSFAVGQDEMIVMSICLQASYAVARRKIKGLKTILKDAEQRANILIKNSKSAVAYIDQGVHVFANDPYLEMFGYHGMEDIIGVPVVDLFSSGEGIKGFKQFLRRFDKGERSDVEFAFESKRTDGTTFASKLQLAAATLEGEPVTQMIIQRDGANAEEMAKKLAAVERQDILTGLPNRIALTEELAKVREEAVSSNLSAALLFINLDELGKINSSAGLSGVDTTVKNISYLLSEQFSESFISRFSDANFAVIVSEKNKAEIQTLAEQLRERAEKLLIEVGSRTVTTTLSIGAVMIDSNAPESQTILDRAIETVADIQRNTDNQGNKVHFFDISEHASEDEDALAEYLTQALSNNRFILRYQPAYDIINDNSDMFETYVTLPMADGTELTLDKFSQVAKKYNLLDKLDRWVLINACKQLAMVRKTQPAANLLIGLSAASLADGQLTKIITQLTKAVGGKNTISLQFGEQDLVDYLAVAKRQFMALTEIGCPVGIRNFGITAKSVETAEYLVPNMVRLARSYTKDLDRPANMEAVSGLVARANEHSVAVLMPYIDNAQAMSTAWSMGVRYVQGDYLQPSAESIVYAEAE
ncbi:MAG: EAL domain-containing protein [Moraxella sp.]|nr:EAL domain-containing protein [Moraxella sp.]